MSGKEDELQMSQQHPSRLWIFVGGTLLVIGTLILVGRQRVPAIDAQTLLTQVNRVSQPPLDTNQVLHYRATVYERMNPEASEPTDPYHKPALELYSDTYEIEHWIRGGESHQSRMTARDSRSGELLYDRMRDGNRYGFYHAASGYAIVRTQELEEGAIEHKVEEIPAELQGEPAFPFPELTRLEGFEIETIISAWGKPAWLVRARGAPPSVESAIVATTPSAFQKPYLADLDITQMKYIWVIDQESWRLVNYVRYEEHAITSADPVLVKRVESSPPEVLPVNALPDNWLAFPPEGLPVMEETPISQISSPPSMPLDEAIAAADFQVFLPDSTTLEPARTIVHFKPEPEPEEQWRSRWRFDIQSAAAHGLALQVIYLPGPLGNGKAFVIIQGPRGRLVSLMRETLPIWAESHAVHLTIGAQEVTGWVATGGVLNTPPEQVVVMLEMQNTFLFVVGQGYTEEQVLNLVRTLHPVR